LFQINRKIY